MTEQLKCKICKTKRELSEEELKELYDIIEKKKLEPSAFIDILNICDGKTCNGDRHEYDWNEEFFSEMLDDSAKIRENTAEIIRKTNENKDLEIKIIQLKKDTENKIKEFEEKISKNKESNISMEKSNIELKDAILKASGREWNRWL